MPMKSMHGHVPVGDETVIALISEVRARPTLWDHRLGDFQKQAQTTKPLWDEIGAAVDLPGDAVKVKWKSLKDQYRRALQARQRKSKLGKPSASKWRFFDKMHFVREVLTPYGRRDWGDEEEEFDSTINDTEHVSERNTQKVRKTRSSTIHNRSNEDATKPKHYPDYADNESSDASSDDHEKTTEISAVEMQGSRKKRGPATRNRKGHSQDVDSGVFKGKKTRKRKSAQLEEVQSKQTKENKTAEDDDYYFLMSLHPFLKPLPPFEKLELRSRLLSQVMDTYNIHKQKTQEGYPQTQTDNPEICQIMQEQPTCVAEYEQSPND